MKIERDLPLVGDQFKRSLEFSHSFIGLIETVEEWIDRAKENLDEAGRYGHNTPGYGMAMGELEAYERVLELLKTP